MKILTNVQASTNGGIYVYFQDFLDYLARTSSDLNIVGVNLHKRDGLQLQYPHNNKFTPLTYKVDYPASKETLFSINFLAELRIAYNDFIVAYKRILQEQKPDLVWINGTYFQPWALMQAAQELGFPVIVHYHGVALYEHESPTSAHSAGNLMMEQSFCDPNFTYIFPSQLTQGLVEREIYKQQITKSHVLSNPIDPIFRHVNNQGNENNVGFVGRWSYVKNPEAFYNLAVYNQQKSAGFKFYAITDQRRIADRLAEIEKVITLSPSLPHAEMGKFYADMGVILSPSIFETFGVVPLEAILSGTPAIVSSNMGVAEVFQSLGLQDFIIASEDFANADFMLAKISAVSKVKINDQTRAEIVRRFDPGAIFSTLVKLFESAV